MNFNPIYGLNGFVISHESVVSSIIWSDILSKWPQNNSSSLLNSNYELCVSKDIKVVISFTFFSFYLLLKRPVFSLISLIKFIGENGYSALWKIYFSLIWWSKASSKINKRGWLTYYASFNAILYIFKIIWIILILTLVLNILHFHC